jgi:hypothetical protein
MSSPPRPLHTRYYNVGNANILCADRAVGNFMEQALAFLPLVWMAFFAAAAAGQSTADITLATYIYTVRCPPKSTEILKILSSFHGSHRSRNHQRRLS